jgi:hypothetical protein
MAITDHIAILAHASLDQPRVNKLNPQKPASFYAQIAFPPSAGADLQALAAAVAPGGNFAGMEVGVKTNAQLAKPLPGVPGDWFVVRSSTQFAPYVADGAGVQLDQGNPAQQALIRTQFYAGKKVRASLAAFAWAQAATGRRGISFSLAGVMANEDSERLNIGAGVVVNTFAKYADPSKATIGTAANPFGQPAQTMATPAGVPLQAVMTEKSAGAAVQAANPFAAQPAAGGNPFAQGQAANNGNPFAA